MCRPVLFSSARAYNLPGGEEMNCEEQKNLPSKPHCLSLENREKLNITGVEDVKGFDENIIILITALGNLNIRGQDLHIDKIDLDTGKLELRGLIQELSYEEPAKASKLWQRLFG